MTPITREGMDLADMLATPWPDVRLSLSRLRSGSWCAHLQGPDVKHPGGWRDGPQVRAVDDDPHAALNQAIAAWSAPPESKTS